MALHVLPIIMAGGSSTRQWPFSRALYPKQLLALSGDQTLTLTALFAQQASINEDADPILIVTPAGQTVKQSATAKSKAKRGVVPEDHAG